VSLAPLATNTSPAAGSATAATGEPPTGMVRSTESRASERTVTLDEPLFVTNISPRPLSYATLVGSVPTGMVRTTGAATAEKAATLAE
jgi:hypothetical protein